MSNQTRFWNPGDAFTRVRNLLEPGEKETRNPLLVVAFRRIGFSENAGWGLHDVFTAWQDLGNPAPELNNDKARKAFELILKKEAQVEVHDGVHDGVHDNLNETELKILCACEDAKNTPELLDILGYNTRTRNYRTALAHLLDADLLNMTLPESPRSKAQKYVLSEKGAKLLNITE